MGFKVRSSCNFVKKFRIFYLNFVTHRAIQTWHNNLQDFALPTQSQWQYSSKVQVCLLASLDSFGKTFTKIVLKVRLGKHIIKHWVHVGLGRVFYNNCFDSWIIPSSCVCLQVTSHRFQRGKLDVVADDGRDIYVTLGDGAVFGEVSWLLLYLALKSWVKNREAKLADVRWASWTSLGTRLETVGQRTSGVSATLISSLSGKHRLSPAFLLCYFINITAKTTFGRLWQNTRRLRRSKFISN